MSSSFRASPIKGLQTYPYRDRISYSPVTPVVPPFVIDETQRLNELLYQKDLQINRLDQQIIKLRCAYDQQIDTYKKTIEALQNELNEKDKTQDIEYQRIKQKFQSLNNQDTQTLKSLHSHEIDFLLKQIAQQRASNDTLNLRLTIQSQQIERIKESYERQISTNVTQINTLNKVISKLQDEKNKQIRQLNNKRQLQKSRTSGLISSRRENNNFMDRQMRKMNEQMVEKTLQIESLSRQLGRERKKFQDTVRSHNNLMNQLKQRYEQQLEEERQQYMKTQKSLRQELKQVKQQIMGYIEKIDDLKSQLNLREKYVQGINEELAMRKEEIQNLKISMERMRQEHGNQIMNLMKERRKSRSHIGSSRSIISLRQSGVIADSNEISQTGKYENHYSSSGRLQKNLHPIKEQTPDRAEQKDYSRQLADSQLQQDEGLIESQLQKAVYHYDSLIQELKRNHQQELQILRINDKKLRARLEAKEQQLLDILTKFSPLVKIHAGQKSLEQDRRQRIQKHWKGDVALLQVLLKKYKIKVFQ